MRVGLLGPANTADLMDHLHGDGDALPSGMGGFPLTLLVRALLERGIAVRLVTLDLTIQRAVHARGDLLEIIYVPCRQQGRGRDAYARERSRLRAAVDRFDVDVWNAHWSYEYAQAVLGLDLPVVITVHDWAPAVLRYFTDPYRAMRLAMFARTHVALRAQGRRPRAMTTPSPYIQQKLAKAGLGRAEVVPNGLPNDYFAARRRVRGDGMALLGMAVGFTKLKNTHALMQAHAELRRSGLDTTLTLVGTDHGPHEAAQRWADERGIGDGIRFLGMRPREEVLALVSATDLLVHPSREESFGMVLIEAMAQGTPVIGGVRSGAVPWVLAHGEAGILVDINDPSAMAEAIGGLLGDASEWERRSDAGLRLTRERFSMDVVAEGYLQVYAQLVGQG